MIVEIDVDEQFFETYGSGTLQGLIHKKYAFDLSKISVLVITFKETSIFWQRANNGPRLYVMAEHAPRLFLVDVLQIIGVSGCVVSVQAMTEDP